jgi:ATPase subunit of ABC transporter with duplicated ATPase domains
MLEWLEDWLNGFQGAALIVSHDRAFLDNTVTSILELDPDTHSIKSYPGNYADYLEQKLTEREKQVQTYQDQQDEIAQLRAAAAHIRGLTKMKKGGKPMVRQIRKGFFGNRATKNVAGRAKHIEARIEKLLIEERIEKPKSSWQMKLDFGAPAHQSRDVLVTEKLSVGIPAPFSPTEPAYSCGSTHRADRPQRDRQNHPRPYHCRETESAGWQPEAGYDRQTGLHGAGAGIAQPGLECLANHPERRSIQ